jgi:hypothetical protein
MIHLVLTALLTVGRFAPDVHGAATETKLPDAGMILDRYVQVTGGAEHYRHFNFVSVDSSITPEAGEVFYTTVFRARDGRVQTVVDAGDDSREWGVSNGVAWQFSKAKGARILSGKAAERAIANAVGLGEDDWKTRFPAVKTLGEETIAGKPCYHVQLTRTDGSAIQRFYEKKSGLLRREVSSEFGDNDAEQTVQTDIEEYAVTIGSTYPSVSRMKEGSRRFTVQVNSLSYSPGPTKDAFLIPREVARAAADLRKSQDLPNAVDIVDKFIEATGGHGVYKAVTTEVIKAEVGMKDQNVTYPVEVYAAKGKSYISFDIPSLGKFELGTDGRTAWQKSVMLGPKLVPAATFGSLIGPFADDVLKWTDASLGLETLSQSEVSGAPCYVVGFAAKEGTETGSTACFDVKTGYLVKSAAPGQDGTEAVILFSDYRPENGFVMAHYVETRMSGHVMSIALKEIKVNGTLPAGIFDLPPDVQALLDRKTKKSESSADDFPDHVHSGQKRVH